MPVNLAAENALATIGTVMWMVQLVPQIFKSYREKSTEGLSPWLMFIWALSAPFLGVYMIAQNISIPLILQPQLFGAMSALSWIQCLYYGYQKSKLYCCLVYLSFLAMFGGFEGGFAILVQHKYQHGDVWSLRTFSLLSSVFLSAGLLRVRPFTYCYMLTHHAYSPQYWEIWKRREVVGISILFMTIDMLGGVFSALSLIFKVPFDTFAAVPYLLVVVLDALIIVLAMILNPLARRRRRKQESRKRNANSELC